MGATESTATPQLSGFILWKAATNGDVEKIKRLVEHPEIGDVVNWTHPELKTSPLMAAAANGKHKVVVLLLDRGADINQREDAHGNTALHLAAMKNHVCVIEKLFQRHCDPHVWNHDGMTALDLARLRSHREASNVFARHLVLAKGWLYMKKGHSIFLSWHKRWCMIYECSVDHSRLELCIFNEPDDVKPRKILFLTATENATSPRAVHTSRHRSKHSFSFTATTTYQKYDKDSFSRNLNVRKTRHIPVYNASGFRFATETLEGRDKWVELLGPLAFTPTAIAVARSTSSVSDEEIIHEPSSEPTPLLDRRQSSLGPSESRPCEYVHSPSAPPLEEDMPARLDMNECVICMDMPRTAVCVPCGHLAGCYKCLVEIQKKSGCPICRSSITTVVRVYTC